MFAFLVDHTNVENGNLVVTGRVVLGTIGMNDEFAYLIKHAEFPYDTEIGPIYTSKSPVKFKVTSIFIRPKVRTEAPEGFVAAVSLSGDGTPALVKYDLLVSKDWSENHTSDVTAQTSEMDGSS